MGFSDVMPKIFKSSNRFLMSQRFIKDVLPHRVCTLRYPAGYAKSGKTNISAKRRLSIIRTAAF